MESGPECGSPTVVRHLSIPRQMFRQQRSRCPIISGFVGAPGKEEVGLVGLARSWILARHLLKVGRRFLFSLSCLVEATQGIEEIAGSPEVRVPVCSSSLLCLAQLSEGRDRSRLIAQRDAKFTNFVEVGAA